VVINAISPIAATRMVAAALGGALPTSGPVTGGLSLGSMPAPADLGPLGAHLVSDTFTSCRGVVLFAGGSEVAVIGEPRLLEVMRSDGVPGLAQFIETATTIALSPAQARQVSGGASNARFGSMFEVQSTDDLPSAAARSCAIVTDRPDAAAALSGALRAWGVMSRLVDSPAALADLDDLDAVVVALAHTTAVGAASDWERILAEHDGIVEQIHIDARWARAVTEYATTNNRPVRLVTLTQATTAGGRSRAQASAQLARSGRKATGDLVLPFTISAESDGIPAELVAHLACSPAAVGLCGAELATGAGWFGLRSHPGPIGSINFGGPALPEWFDATLQQVAQPR
jgi:hypothetical protein